jgi:Uma2 family endonuclease
LTATKVKMQRWIENGTKLAWLVDPYGRKVYVYSPGVAPVTVSDSTVRGTGPVEGFVLDLTRVWRGFRV